MQLEKMNTAFNQHRMKKKMHSDRYIKKVSKYMGK